MGTTAFPDIVRIFSATAELILSSTATAAGPSLTYGAAAPALAKTAGSIYMRTGTGTIYINTDGTTTGWKPVGIIGGSGSTLVAASTAASATIGNTMARTVFSTSTTLAANTLAVGDVLRVTGWGVAVRAAMETFLLDLSFGGVALAAPAAIGAAGDFTFEATATVRAIGAAGVGAIASGAQFHLGTAPTADSDVEAAAIDTTVANVLGIGVTMSAAATGTTATLQGFVVEKLRA